MVNFFLEGGFGMYPVLALGVVLMLSSVRFAVSRDPMCLRFIVFVAVALAINTFAAMLIDIAQVLRFVEDAGRVSNAEFSRVLAMGLKESSRPGVLGFGFLSVASIVVAVGVYRIDAHA